MLAAAPWPWPELVSSAFFHPDVKVPRKSPPRTFLRVPQKTQLLQAPNLVRHPSKVCLSVKSDLAGRSTFTVVSRQNSEPALIQALEAPRLSGGIRCKNGAMPRLFTLLVTLAAGPLRSRHDLLLENLALRQQLAAVIQKYPRPRLTSLDRIFWVLLRRFWSGWRGALVVVQPETVSRVSVSWYQRNRWTVR
jgi:hypothetical protein